MIFGFKNGMNLLVLPNDNLVYYVGFMTKFNLKPYILSLPWNISLPPKLSIFSPIYKQPTTRHANPLFSNEITEWVATLWLIEKQG